MDFRGLGCLTSLLPSPVGFSEWAIVILNSALRYLASATSLFLYSSPAGFADIPQKSQVNVYHRAFAFAVTHTSTQNSSIISNRFLPKDLLFKKEPDIRPSLMGDVSPFPLQYFGGQKALKFPSSPCFPLLHGEK